MVKVMLRRIFRRAFGTVTAVCLPVLAAIPARNGACSGAPDPGSVPIRLVLVDAFTEKALGPMPWSREYHARVVDWLGKAGAAAIGLRFYFRDEQDPEADAGLAQSVLAAGSVFIETGRSEFPQGWEPPPEWLKTAGLDSRGPLPADIPELPHLQLPFADLARAARGIGSVDMLVDKDRQLRALPLLVRHGAYLLPSLALRIYLALSGLESSPVTFLAKEEYKYWIWPIMRTKGVLIGRVRIALDDAACAHVDFSAPGSAYQAFSYIDLLEGRADPKPFKGAVVLVGSASKDALVNTPLGAKNGAELVADQLSALFEFARNQ